MQKMSAKEKLGFVGDYITILKGQTYPFKEWLKERGSKYNPRWGWYFATNVEVPTDLPADIFPVQLFWNQISANGTDLNNDDAISEVIDNLLYDPTPSEYQGEIGERLELEVHIDKVIPLDGFYGKSSMHIMSDENENVYVWTTASRTLKEDSFLNIRGTVKDHRTYHNCKQTILTRCKVVEG